MADNKGVSSLSGTFTWVVLQFPVLPEAKPYLYTVSDQLERNFWTTRLHDAFHITTQVKPVTLERLGGTPSALNNHPCLDWEGAATL